MYLIEKKIFHLAFLCMMLVKIFLLYKYKLCLDLTYHCSQDTVALNNPDIVGLNMAAVTGVGNAKDLATLFSLAINGTLLSNKTLALITQPTLTNWHLEQVCFFFIFKAFDMRELHSTPGSAKHLKLSKITGVPLSCDQRAWIFFRETSLIAGMFVRTRLNPKQMFT